MAIQPKREAVVALETVEASQMLMQMTVANRAQTQAAIDKVNQAAAPVIKALEEQLKKLTEENSHIEKELEKSLQEEASWDRALHGEVCNMNHQKTCLTQSIKDYKSRHASYKPHLDHCSMLILKELAEFARIAGVPFNDVKKNWEQDHPGFFKIATHFL